MATYVITGANRGLGLEFVTQLSSQPSNLVLAVSRTISPNKINVLESLKSTAKNIHILECDTSSIESINSFASKVTTLLGPEGKIDYLLNNAGVNSVPHQNSLSLTAEGLYEDMKVNVLGPAKVVEALVRHLQRGSKVMNMSSELGSLTEARANPVAQCTAYSISKAGLNMLTVHQATEMTEKGVIFICMDPGWVTTDMGREGSPLQKEESIGGMLRCLSSLSMADSGRYFLYNGTEKQW